MTQTGDPYVKKDWRVRCASCGWVGYRRQANRENVEADSCPQCGEPQVRGLSPKAGAPGGPMSLRDRSCKRTLLAVLRGQVYCDTEGRWARPAGINQRSLTAAFTAGLFSWSRFDYDDLVGCRISMAELTDAGRRAVSR
jgi:hypothetical protein